MRTIIAAAIAGLFLAAPPEVRAQDSNRDCPQCLEMVRIPAGSFTMGPAPGEHAREAITGDEAKSELPQHKVAIRNTFSLGRSASLKLTHTMAPPAR